MITVRRTVMAGGAVGLAIPLAVLALLEIYGVWQIMVGRIDLRAVLWPSSIMLPINWYCTVAGLLTTMSSLAINCLIYIAIALLLRAGVRAVAPHRGAGN